MAYCAFCSRLIELITSPAPPRLDADHRQWDFEKDCKFRDSAQQCTLCKFIYQQLKALCGKQSFSLDDEGKLRQMRLINRYGPRYRKGELDMPLCRLELHFPSLDDKQIADFFVWAEVGDPAAATITTQPPIHKDESETDQICSLVHNRLYDCITSHAECGQSSGPGTQPRLPTRVLYVKNATSYDKSVRLVETHGATGAYCALSHCWGPVDRQPIRTLKANIQDHYSAIPLTALPRTFREAVILTQRLGIDYVWIDSLCIQQDDDDDWRREAASMGSLYQQATLVIAAAGSEDPTGGLFICERSPKISLQLPYGTKGVFNLAFRTPSPTMRPFTNDYGGPLQERAWALQEFYLAQRMVLFGEHGVDWRCYQCECDESGADDDLGLYEHLGWFVLLKIYTRKKLTRHSDRMVALQGIVDEERKSRDDIFLSEGMWEKEILQHLLWYRTSVLATGDLSLPSWSWGATEGSKKWICDPTWDYNPQYDYSCVEIKRLQPGRLSVSGDLVQAEVGWEEINVWQYVRSKIGFMHTSSLGILLDFAQTHLLQSAEGILGFATLDRNEGPSSLTDHSNMDFCVLGKMTTSDVAEESDVATAEGSGLFRLNDYNNNLSREFRDIDYVLWALVLEPLAENEATYRRAGLAMLFPRVQTAGYCRSARFTLK